MTEQTPTPQPSLRDLAARRLKKKRDFWIHLLMYVMVNAFFVAIWATSGGGYFWPVFIIFGWGIGVAANAWDAYGREPTEDDISREMERMRQRR